MYSFVRAKKFWQRDENIQAVAVVWEIVCKPVLGYASEVWACPSLDSERKLEQVHERAGTAILGLLGLLWRFPGVAIRGDMGWARQKYGRHCRALKFTGRVSGMGLEHWPRIVVEALAEHLGTGTWADYGYTWFEKYGLPGKWKEENCTK